MIPDQSTLDQRVAMALGWKRDLNNDRWWLFHGHPRLMRDFSTDPDYVGDLLLEAQKRGWTVFLDFVQSRQMWICRFNENYAVESATLSEAVSRAFVAAHERQDIAALLSLVDRQRQLTDSLEKLLVCYRVGKHPSDKLLDAISGLRKALEDSR